MTHDRPMTAALACAADPSTAGAVAARDLEDFGFVTGDGKPAERHDALAMLGAFAALFDAMPADLRFGLVADLGAPRLRACD